MEYLEDILIPIFGILAVFGTGFGITYLIVSSRHRERMSMIERGMDPNAHKAPPEPNKALRDGLLIVGVGLGLLAGWLFRQHVMGDSRSPLPLFIGAAIFGGSAQVIYYLKFGRKRQG